MSIRMSIRISMHKSVNTSMRMLRSVSCVQVRVCARVCLRNRSFIFVGMGL